MVENTYGFLVDTSRCIECGGCEVACKREQGVERGVNWRKVVTVDEGVEGEEEHWPMSCLHCSDAPCATICPVNAIEKRDDGIVTVDDDECIGCGYCLYACPFGAPQFGRDGATGSKGTMNKCTFCVDRIEEGKEPACAANCVTNAILAGDMTEITEEYQERVAKTGKPIVSP
ncbi:4Fe-4S dicluster domain-containing protein [Methanonatronarchaeum sp. AMET-Sl]|uniref:4Fe-4S dicluster domain-containing protein n=1 Tax=Methanonatronarchaeum sp. AMET-Sl TaxID=3037654 RepID=UPI00244DF5BB|nr:4Fe-4S dicluster domain-containing protein [Methanonatronarchaeum sp. AMET-Sl]WGI16826.1 4Fe-4S dicluster domain-containing protein [Methanonatronarchaeum sp. AMET-Sl]